MGYKVNHDALDVFFNGIGTRTNTWMEQLKDIAASVETLSGSTNMSGKGAESIMSYMNAVHGTILAALSELLSLHVSNCRLYKNDYQHNIDRALHANIEESELKSIGSQISAQRTKALDIYDEVVYTLSQIRDIFYVSYKDVSDVDAAHTSVTQFLDDLDTEIKDLEKKHAGSDFTETEEMISALKAFITEQSSKGRSYMTEFDPASLSNSSAFAKLYAAHTEINKTLEEKAPELEKAVENEKQRVADLEEERAERERKAKVINWVVTGVCVVGSVVAIAATGGAATPLVVGGISACSGAIISGTHNLTAQYVENGSLDNADWGSFGKDVLIGGVTGFVTGYAGATVSGMITSGLSTTGLGSTMLNSSNAAVRIGTGAVIGSASEVGSGIVSRGAGTFISSGGDVDAALNAAFDKESIVIDAVTGGVSGGISSAKKPVGKEVTLDDIDDELLDSKPMNSPNPKKWIEKGGSINVDGNGTWTYTNSEGISVCYSDGYPDFKRAGIVEKEVDIGSFSDSRTKDFRNAEVQTPKPPDTTWHHSQDGHTLQAVDTRYHKQFTHKGGFSLANGG